jgi:zinc transport system ATP-binding protein
MSQADHTKNIIELRGVSFGYTDEPVLENISLKIHQGDYLGVVGPNGGGKTTMLKIMLGLLKPRSGEVSLFGQPINKFKDWWRIGYVPQKAVNFDVRFPATVLEIVLMGRFGKRGLLRRMTKEDKDKALWSLEQVGMQEYKDRLIGDLSAGQQQRVFIARALAGEPEVIFLDEPTAGVDIESQEKFYILLRKLNTDLNLTLVLISHDIGIIASEATEMAHVNRKLTYHGSAEEFADLKVIATHRH